MVKVLISHCKRRRFTEGTARTNAGSGILMLTLIVLSATCIARPVVTHSAREPGKYDVTFVLRAPGAKSVNLAGSFNGWNTTSTPMEHGAGDAFKVAITVPKGEHQYKFVVDGTTWKEDPDATGKAEDGQGGNNSVVRADDSSLSAGGAPAAAAAAGPAKTAAPASKGPLVQMQPDGKARVTFTLNAPGAKSVNVAGSFNGWNTTSTPMEHGARDVFKTTITLPEGEHQYKFVIDGTNWKEDPNAAESTDDGQGGKNSVLKIGVAPAGKPAGQTGAPPAGGPRVEMLPGGKGRVTFTYAAPAAEKVYLAGNFNGWMGNKDEMVKVGDTFTTSVVLDPDDYAYKFVVNGNDWKQDPTNAESEDDGNGGKNSVVHVGAGSNFKVSEEQVGDGKILAEALHHDPASIDYFNPMQDGSVVLKLRAAAHDISSATLVGSIWFAGGFSDWSDPRPFVVTLSPEYGDERFQFFRAVVDWDKLATGEKDHGSRFQLRYSFLVQDSKTVIEVSANGSQPITEARHSATRNQSASFNREIKSDFSTPDWARSVVWYEIFPERFRNGDPSNDPKEGLRKWTSDWWTRAQDGTETGPAMEMGVFGRRYGGDMKGALEKLPYLKELGVGAVWFNPVFQSESLHKYDTQDYRHIDEHFGTLGDWEQANAKEDLLDPKTWTWTESDKLFLEFVKRAHAVGMRVIVDGVFNHTGTMHPAFQDLKKNGKNSRFADWYEVKNWQPFEYEGWGGFGGLPVLKEDANGYVSPTLRKHIKDITRRWMDPNGDGNPEDGVDGWRLDVPNEVSAKFWSEWRAVVKDVNPNAIILGEIWDPPAKWLKGDQFDAVMNYQLAKALTRFITNSGKATTLQQDWSRMLHQVPDQSNYVMMNLMDSHDTDRLASQLNNPGREFDASNRQQEQKHKTYTSQKPSAEVYQKMKELSAVQFCYVGAPMIYYGDEAGMWGADDPEDRKPMLWKDLEPYEKPEENHVMDDVWQHYQKLAAIRNSVEALNTGEYEPLLADDVAHVFAFRRWNEKQNVVIVANDSNEPRELKVPTHHAGSALTPGQSYVDVLFDKGVRVEAPKADSKARTSIQIGNVTAIRSEGDQLPVRIGPHETHIYESVGDEKKQ